MLLLSLLCIISIGYLYFLGENIRNYGPKKIVYYASNVNIVGPHIVKYLQDDGLWYQKRSFIEIGGGLAPLARYVGKHLNFKSLIAVEWARSICAAGKAKNVISRPSVTYVRTLIEDYTIDEPAVLYCYLSEDILTEQFNRHVFDGCLLFSLTFKIRGVEPDKVLNLEGWQSPLRVYDFR